jgi:hypothetical protein
MVNEINQELVDGYKKARGIVVMQASPTPFVPRPTKNDYKFGEIKRYFAQQANQENGIIIEISENQFTSLRKDPLFIIVSLRWKISGSRTDKTEEIAGQPVKTIVGVKTANEAAIRQAAKTMPGIRNKLSNPFQLHRSK